MTGRDIAITLALTAVAAAAVTADYIATPFDPLFEAESKRSGVPADLLRALARHESGFRPTAVSEANRNGTRDRGLMQINEATAQALGLDQTRLLEPAYNIAAAAKLLAQLKRELGPRFSPYTWVAAYNAGSPAIIKRGVFNTAYAASVTFHWQLYQVAAALKALGSGQAA